MPLLPILIFAVAAVPAQMPFTMGGPHPRTMTLMRTEVQKELKLSGEQKKAVKQALDDMGTQAQAMAGIPMPAIGGMPSMDIDEKVLPILDAEQAARLQELWFQYEGPTVLRTKPVAGLFGLSDEQRARVGTLMSEFDAAIATEYRKMSGNPMGGRAIMDGIKKRRKDVNAALLESLTSEQQAAYKTALGKQFKFPGGVREM